MENKEEKNKMQETKIEKKESEEKIVETKEDKKQEEKTEGKSKEKKKEIIKKDIAIARGKDLRISAKKAAGICDLIRGKKIEKAMEELEQIAKKKMAVRMRGQYAHQKGIGGGCFPETAAKEIIKIIRSLQANSIVNGLDLEKTIIKTARANLASRPNRRGGRKFKRTHVLFTAEEIKPKEEKK